MSEDISDNGSSGWLGRMTANQGKSWIAGTALLAAGLVGGGYLMGDGLVRMKQADRAVTVRGLAERDVTADLATWTIAYSAAAGDLQSAQAKADTDTRAQSGAFSRHWALTPTRSSRPAPMSRNIPMTASPPSPSNNG